MSSDLYDALGIDRDADADADAVSRAYRAKAKTAHPDAGDDPGEFALISLARDVLSDEDRRQRYDETGKTEKDDQQSAVLSLILGAVRKAMTEALSMGRKPEHVDLLKAAIGSLGADIRQVEQQIGQCRDGAAKASAIAKRFSRKAGESLIGPMFTNDAAMMDAQIIELQRGVDTMKAAMTALADHSFQWDEPAPQYGQSTTWNPSSLLGLRL